MILYFISSLCCSGKTRPPSKSKLKKWVNTKSVFVQSLKCCVYIWIKCICLVHQLQEELASEYLRYRNECDARSVLYFMCWSITISWKHSWTWASATSSSSYTLTYAHAPPKRKKTKVESISRHNKKKCVKVNKSYKISLFLLLLLLLPHPSKKKERNPSIPKTFCFCTITITKSRQGLLIIKVGSCH